VDRDSLSRCLKDRLCEVGNGVFEFGCGVERGIWIKSEVYGGSEEGPVCVIVVVRWSGGA